VNQTIADAEALVTQHGDLDAPLPAHLERLRGATRVSTPQGPGTLLRVTPWQVDVNLDATGQTRSFIDAWHFERIVPLDEDKPYPITNG